LSRQSCPRVELTHELGLIGWVGLGRGSETFPQILKHGRPLATGKVTPDNLIMIVINEQYLINFH